jgi:hypothetical protein
MPDEPTSTSSVDSGRWKLVMSGSKPVTVWPGLMNSRVRPRPATKGASRRAPVAPTPASVPRSCRGRAEVVPRSCRGRAEVVPTATTATTRFFAAPASLRARAVSSGSHQASGSMMCSLIRSERTGNHGATVAATAWPECPPALRPAPLRAQRVSRRRRWRRRVSWSSCPVPRRDLSHPGIRRSGEEAAVDSAICTMSP